MGISAAARAYLENTVGLMQANSINRLTIDWTALRADVFAAAGPAGGAFIFVAVRTCTPSGGSVPAVAA